MTQALYFIVKTLAQLYLLLLLLRFWLPWFNVDFRNPMAQGVLRLTSPLIAPLRRFIPPAGRLDTATILVALAIEYLLVVFLLSIRGISVGFVPIAATAFFELVILSLNLLFFVILIRIVLSWVAPGNYSPVTAMLNALAEPVLRPFRRMIPPIGGLDISPIFAIILLQAAIIILQTYKPIPF
ncbi:MAG: YggT family protein [Gammaproteobacteria bacterium]|nr:MAG: YggT family protein [Gammaproteobacteria bacterium]